jgi:hypothetical protein
LFALYDELDRDDNVNDDDKKSHQDGLPKVYLLCSPLQMRVPVASSAFSFQLLNAKPESVECEAEVGEERWKADSGRSASAKKGEDQRVQRGRQLLLTEVMFSFDSS